MVIVMAKGKPCPHFWTILFIFVTTITVFCIEIWDYSFEEK